MANKDMHIKPLQCTLSSSSVVNRTEDIFDFSSDGRTVSTLLLPQLSEEKY